MIDRLLNEKEAADHLGISENQLRELARKKKVPVYKIGGQFLRFDPKDLEAVKVFIPAADKKQTGYSLLNRFRDYFYYNDFYIIVAILIIILLALVFKASF